MDKCIVAKDAPKELAAFVKIQRFAKKYFRKYWQTKTLILGDSFPALAFHKMK
jgi:hypothetical protein